MSLTAQAYRGTPIAAALGSVRSWKICRRQRWGKNASRAADPQPADVLEYLQGMDYPAPRNKLIAAAYEHRAPQTVVDILQRLPETADFRAPQDLERALKGVTLEDGR